MKESSWSNSIVVSLYKCHYRYVQQLEEFKRRYLTARTITLKSVKTDDKRWQFRMLYFQAILLDNNSYYSICLTAKKFTYNVPYIRGVQTLLNFNISEINLKPSLYLFTFAHIHYCNRQSVCYEIFIIIIIIYSNSLYRCF